MAMDIHKLFNEDLPARIAENPGAAKQLGAKYQFLITGEGGGAWFVDASDSGPKCVQGNGDGADCTITITVEDFTKLPENPQANFMPLFFAGKVKVSGDNMLAMRLDKLFALVK
jgi:putative sterol carrier protein